MNITNRNTTENALTRKDIPHAQNLHQPLEIHLVCMHILCSNDRDITANNGESYRSQMGRRSSTDSQAEDFYTRGFSVQRFRTKIRGFSIAVVLTWLRMSFRVWAFSIGAWSEVRWFPWERSVEFPASRKGIPGPFRLVVLMIINCLWNGASSMHVPWSRPVYTGGVPFGSWRRTLRSSFPRS
jgi:hypothetical protein